VSYFAVAPEDGSRHTTGSWMTALTEPGLARALQAILERPSERFTVQILASIAGMSRSAFAARFAQAFGQTPMNLLRSARLRRARELLATTDIPVTQIAHNVGFSSRSNFSHAFRTAYGVDPTMLRAASFGNSEPDLNEHRG
jgi:AraC family transcriptional regulator, activator of mtrCDE